MLNKSTMPCCPNAFRKRRGLSDSVTSMCKTDKQEKGSAVVCVKMYLMQSEVVRNLCQATLSAEKGTLH